MHEGIIFVEQQRENQSLVLAGRNLLMSALYSLLSLILIVTCVLSYRSPPGVMQLLLLAASIVALVGGWRWFSLQRSLEIDFSKALVTLRGRDWGLLEGQRVALQGRLQLKSCRGGYDNRAGGRFVMLLRLDSGAEYRLGLHSLGAFNRYRLAEYARELEMLSSGQLRFE